MRHWAHEGLRSESALIAGSRRESSPRTVDVLRISQFLAFAILPSVGVVLLWKLFTQQHLLALDFQHWYWPAGGRVLLGQSPYTLPYPQGLNYPALTAIAFAPWAWLPMALAGPAFTVTAMLSTVAVLALLKVRDWRVYGAAFMWPATVYGWQTANLSLILVAGVAAAWRWRDRPVVTGGLLALVVVTKPVFLPMALWLLATRRYRALAWFSASTLVLMLGTFAALGLDQIPAYLHQTQLGMADSERRGYSIFTLVLKLGGSHNIAYLVIAVFGAAITAACLVVGRRGRDRESISLAIAAMVTVSPVVESHYLAVILVPLAITHPRLRPIWLLPLCLWITPADWPTVWQRFLVLAIYAAVVAVVLNRARTLEPNAVQTQDSRSTRQAPHSTPHRPATQII